MPSILKAVAGCPSINNMEVNINMQGWYAVIVGGRCIAAFVEYEDALVYRRAIQADGTEIVIERIDHRKG